MFSCNRRKKKENRYPENQVCWFGGGKFKINHQLKIVMVSISHRECLKNMCPVLTWASQVAQGDWRESSGFFTCPSSAKCSHFSPLFRFLSLFLMFSSQALLLSQPILFSISSFIFLILVSHPILNLILAPSPAYNVFITYWKPFPPSFIFFKSSSSCMFFLMSSFFYSLSHLESHLLAHSLLFYKRKVHIFSIQSQFEIDYILKCHLELL